MKKLVCFLLVLTLCFLVCGCGKETPNVSSLETSSTVSKTQTEVFTAPELEPLPSFWGTKPTITWSTLKCGATARIIIEDENGEVLIDKKDLVGTSYTLEKTLSVGKFYTLKAIYVRDGKEFAMIGNSKKGKRIFCYEKKDVTLKDVSNKITNSKDYMITFIGDSVTWGAGKTSEENSYPALFAKKLKTKFADRTIIRYDGVMNGERVPLKEYSAPVTVNEGTNGKITIVRSGVGSSEVTHTINRMNSDFMGTANGRLPKKADLFVIHLGINDHGHGATPQVFKERLVELVSQMLSRQSETDIILMTPTSSVSSSKAPAEDNPLNKFSDAMKEVAQEFGLAVIDVHQLWMDHYVQGGPFFGMGEWHYDQWHPSDKGYAAMADKIFEDLFN